MEDLKNLLHWSAKYWYIYIISLVVCAAIGITYYCTTPFKFKVNASVMLRTPSGGSAQDQLIKMMGVGVSDNSADEIEIFSSATLMEEVVNRLNVEKLYYTKVEGKWQILYPSHPFEVVLPEGCRTNVTITMTKDGDKYKLKVKDSRDGTKRFRVATLSEPIKTHIGDISINATKPIEDGKYRIVCLQKQWAINYMQHQVEVSRESRESKIIHFTSNTTSPRLMRDVISTMLDIYTNQSTTDKTMVASETETFLNARISSVAYQLDSAEAAIETYKRVNQIANLKAMAETYRNHSDAYEHKLLQLDADLTMLDYINNILISSQDDYSLIPSETGVNDATLSYMVNTYNLQVMTLQNLRQTAKQDNPTVVIQVEKLKQTKQTLLNTIEQCRQATKLNRQNVKSQYDLYVGRLQDLPEQERHYLELERERNAREKQYLYLVEQQEANALLLSSDAMPAKIVERPTIYPESISPDKRIIIIMVIIIAFGLPVALFFFIQIFQFLYSPKKSLSEEN